MLCPDRESHMTQRNSFRAVLIGKNSLIREGLASVLRSAKFRILASVSCANDCPPCKAQPGQLLFLIVHTGDNFCSAIEQIELIRGRDPGGSIAIVTDHYRLDEVVSALRAGANGYFTDVMTRDVFIKSLELVTMGETVFPLAFVSFILGSESGQIDDADPRDENDDTILVQTEDEIAPQLSPREKSILRCLIEGDSNKSIARKMDIAEATVKVHVKAILRKIRVHNRTQAAIWWINNGSLVQPPNDKAVYCGSNANRGLAETAREIPNIKRLDARPAVGVINATHLPRAGYPIRKYKV